MDTTIESVGMGIGKDKIVTLELFAEVHAHWVSLWVHAYLGNSQLYFEFSGRKAKLIVELINRNTCSSTFLWDSTFVVSVKITGDTWKIIKMLGEIQTRISPRTYNKLFQSVQDLDKFEEILVPYIVREAFKENIRG